MRLCGMYNFHSSMSLSVCLSVCMSVHSIKFALLYLVNVFYRVYDLVVVLLIGILRIVAFNLLWGCEDICGVR